uniref:DNA mismatch repair proteins mutS family domain-containing protein n=1 Tax=Setaria digitata TaxID=48799 RepID=A0A915Q0A0_9BILA
MGGAWNLRVKCRMEQPAACYLTLLTATMLANTTIQHDTSSSVPKYRSFTSTRERSANGTKLSLRSCIIFSLVEGRGNARGEIGLASIDALCSELHLWQFIDSASYARLRIQFQVQEPVEVIVPETFGEKVNSMNAVLELIRSTYPEVEITMINRRYFNDLKGVELLQQLSSTESSNITSEIYKKCVLFLYEFCRYYCMAAAAALIKYVEYIQNVMFAQNSLKVTYLVVEKSCFMDVNTMRNVEVVERIHLKPKTLGRSLFSILNTCLTSGGVRLLRSNLLQPSADLPMIEARLDAIEELMSNQPKFERLRAIVVGISDIYRLIAVCCYLENQKETMRIVEHRITQHLNDERFEKIMDILDEKLGREHKTGERSALALRQNRCYAVREGLDQMIDIMRKAYEELLRDTHEKSNEDSSEIPEAKLVYTASRGFHFSIPCADPVAKVKLPSHFIDMVRNRASISCTTRSLLRYNERIDEVVNELMIRSNVVAVGLLNQIRLMIPCLYHAIEAISMVDFIGCLAIYAMKIPSVRPSFSPSMSMIIKQGRHPLLDLASENFTPNDVYLSPESRINIITGPNMSGKSTYLKQICLLHVLAQTGSFVPAEMAVFPLLTRIFSRIGQNDDLTANLSAFAVEMSEMAPILRTADSLSLVLIDELACSTAYEEGLSLCFAICEELLRRKAYVILATHYLDLASLAAMYPAVENFHFSATTVKIKQSDGNEIEKLQCSHRLYTGPYNGPLYAFNLTDLTTFPKEVVEEARQLATSLRAKHNMTIEIDDETRQRRAIIRFACKLRSMLSILMKTDNSAAAVYLSKLRDQLFRELPPMASHQ